MFHHSLTTFFAWLRRYHLVVLVAILAFAFFTRVYRLEKPAGYVFDEVYHALTSKLIARNDVRAYEWWNQPVEENTAVDWLHPPLAKYTQAAMILMFGENSFGWRISSVIFGVLVVAATYWLARELFHSKLISLVSAGLAASDGLLLAQSRIAMNDIHVTFFILLTMIAYVRYRKSLTAETAVPETKSSKKSKKVIAERRPADGLRATAELLLLGGPTTKWWLALTGLSAGLAMGTKWSGVFVLGLVLGTEAVLTLMSLWRRFVHLQSKSKQTDLVVVGSELGLFSLRKVLLTTLCLIVIPAAIYVGSYTHMFLQGKTLFCHKQVSIQGECYYERFEKNGRVTFEGYLSHFGELHHQIMWYQTNLKATHPFQSRPWQWFLNLKPVWFFVDYSDSTKIANIYAFGNPALFWWGDVAVILTVLAIALAAFLKVTQHHFDKNWLSFPILFLVAGYFIVWLPWQFSPRIMFFYHYAPAVPLLCIILTVWLKKVSRYTVLVPAFVVASIAVCFVVWFPHWTGLPVPKEFADKVYFAIKSWK